MDQPADDLKPLVVRTISANDAARVGLVKALKNTQGDHYEWGGLIFQSPDGRYYAVDPMTSKDGYNVRISQRPDAAGDVLGGIYHTHPSKSDADSQLFSRNDVKAADQLKVPSYIGIERDDAIRAYKPGDPTMPYRGGRAAKGGLVLADLLKGVTTPEERKKILLAQALQGATP